MLTLSRVVFIYPSPFFPSISRANITNSTDTMNVMALLIGMNPGYHGYVDAMYLAMVYSFSYGMPVKLNHDFVNITTDGTD